MLSPYPVRAVYATLISWRDLGSILVLSSIPTPWLIDLQRKAPASSHVDDGLRLLIAICNEEKALASFF
jgi:hypothetical protein